MHLLTFFFFLALLLLLPSTFSTNTPPPPQTITIHHLPSTPTLTSSPTPLATLTFLPSNPSLSRILAFHPPKNSTDWLQIGICYPSPSSSSDPKKSNKNNNCRTTSTRAYTFHPPYTGRFIISVENEEDVGEGGGGGEVLGVAWRAWRRASSDDGKEEQKNSGETGRGEFDIDVARRAPRVWVDGAGVKERKKGREGRQVEGGKKKEEGDGEEEGDQRSFLQKYWWVILGVTVMAMLGGGSDK